MLTILRVFLLIFYVCQSIVLGEYLTPEQLLNLRDEDGLIRITPENYNQLNQRFEEWHQVLYLTMGPDPNTGEPICPVCGPFEETVRRAAKFIMENSPDTKVLFYVSEVEKNADIIREFNLTAVPHLLAYPPIDIYSSPGTPINWAFSQFYEYKLPENAISDVFRLMDFLNQIMGTRINVPLDINDNIGFDYQVFILYFIIFTSIFVILKKITLKFLKSSESDSESSESENNTISKETRGRLNSIYMQIVCICISFGILLTSITGLKFTQMNQIVFIARNGEGQIMYFSGGTGWQFGIEVLTVSLMYVSMALLVVGLVYLYKAEKLSLLQRNIIGIILSAMLYYGFHYYLLCYEIKNNGYPFTYKLF
ncbi:hypothetical protein TBLA_0D01470 [Henningerozyma blattae CBS 6284]|uniref:Thioredoxin domain-containing protein n=1 Tax=Henningerozyma blattae (strain ATCC 34711 / CBS 6284 / DSM 70876 / NBRC 10599 / NRRL Y-10934 / UCD 77-7) TaxID=1071380 RepID=I2H2Q2_HENB6|nr:hypothetical protein TBLA_0D01470 [Tetrapisispora blattae CBS 6284]CCH60654.1 hypothetical protein TBLA_0D01470 [Tetrapisispora blattae CBS 6284]